MKLAWGAKVSPEFVQIVLSICKRFNWPGEYASWLMACMAFETADTFGTRRWSRRSTATGLIGFMRTTALGLGTSVEELATMTPEQQLKYVELYYCRHYKKIKTLADMYMAIFAPPAIGRDDEYKLYVSADGDAYRLNKALDRDGDGDISKIEAAQFVVTRLSRGLEPGNVLEVPWGDRTTELLAGIDKIKVDLAALERIAMSTGV